ncbi:GntR family transcriptional regulator [Verrucomicrobia bacterium]|nr:GntR family transcriptional regulator [Verrucomicrobiota bacterium]
MFLNLNPNSGLPIYRQLFQQLRERIVSGQLEAGEKLPSVRDISKDIKVNMLTVAKVYQMLEAEDLVESRRGLGTFVATGKSTRSTKEKQALIADAVDQVVAEARHLNFTESELTKLVQQRYRKKDNE